MPSKWSWLALGLGAYVAIVVASFPAATAYRAYRAFAPEDAAADLRLGRIDGTVWAGSAALASLPGLPLEDVRWRLEPWPLVLGRIAGEFEARLADGFVGGSVTLRSGRVRFENLRASTGLQTLRGLVPIHDTRGQASAELERLELVDGFPEAASGTLRLAELEVAPLVPSGGPALIALGGYRVDLDDGEPGTIVARIEDTGGPLAVMATLRLGRDRVYTLDGVLQARADASAELVQALEYITGEPDERGMRPFNLSGSL